MTNLKISKPIVCFSISLMTLVKVMDEYINANLLWGCLWVLFVGLAVYCWNKLHQKVILLSLGLFCLSCLIGLFWPVNTTYDGVNKGAFILWSAFFAITPVLVSKMKECNENDKKLLKLIIGLFGGSLFLLCAIIYIGIWMKSK